MSILRRAAGLTSIESALAVACCFYRLGYLFLLARAYYGFCSRSEAAPLNDEVVEEGGFRRRLGLAPNVVHAPESVQHTKPIWAGSERSPLQLTFKVLRRRAWGAGRRE